MDEGSEANLQGCFRFHSKDWGQQTPLAPFPLYTNRVDLIYSKGQSAAGSGVTMRQACLRDSDKYLPGSVYETETALSGQLGWATQSPWTILVYSQTIPTQSGWGAGGGGRLGPGTANHCLELSLRDIFGLWPELGSGSLLLETQWAPFTPNPQWAVLIARLSDEDITKSMKIWEISSSEGRNTVGKSAPWALSPQGGFQVLDSRSPNCIALLSTDGCKIIAVLNINRGTLVHCLAITTLYIA